MPTEKYNKDGIFYEPVVRCVECNKLLLVDTLKQVGCCPHCSNRRVRNVQTFNETEMEQVKGWDVDPDWIALFEGVANVQV